MPTIVILSTLWLFRFECGENRASEQTAPSKLADNPGLVSWEYVALTVLNGSGQLCAQPLRASCKGRQR
jgi:hypothetical protein